MGAPGLRAAAGVGGGAANIGVAALAGAVAHYMRSMAQDVDEAAKGVLQQRMDDEIEDFVDFMESGAPLASRGKRRDGYRTEVHRVTV